MYKIRCIMLSVRNTANTPIRKLDETDGLPWDKEDLGYSPFPVAYSFACFAYAVDRLMHSYRVEGRSNIQTRAAWQGRKDI